MKVSVILAHPDKNSFNHAIARAAAETLISNGHEFHFHDLYDEGFDPLLFHPEFPKGAELPGVVQKHCDEVSSADGIIVIHPNWWGQPPAILKGWIDRVIRPGVAYEFLEGDRGEGIPAGLLKAKLGLVFITSNTSPERERKVFGDPLERIWKDCVFGLCGVETVEIKTFAIVVTSSQQERENWLDETTSLVNKHFPRSS
jgi:putative NADPH-quinone reductase